MMGDKASVIAELVKDGRLFLDAEQEAATVRAVAERDARRIELAEQRKPLVRQVLLDLPSALHDDVHVSEDAHVRAMHNVMEGYTYYPVTIELAGCVPIYAYWYGGHAVYIPALAECVWGADDECWVVAGAERFVALTEHVVSGRGGRKTYTNLQAAICAAHELVAHYDAMVDRAAEYNRLAVKPNEVKTDDPVDRWLNMAEKHGNTIAGAEWTAAAALMAIAYIVRNNNGME